MGQAWCKEKTTKAQDSKSPLDRVFLRCAHRIYPSLKEEGSVLGGATQRVTSSEIGYAGSPPRALLARGCSIDSTDRPFHPSEWVDVNLEVPNTPRASTALTNLTVNTNLYSTTTTTSSCPNLMENSVPVPPPRKRKRNIGRPLPPKPDDITENNFRIESPTSKDEPLYSSVKTPKSKSNYFDSEVSETDSKRKFDSLEDSKSGGKKSKEVFEHMVNGRGWIIPYETASGGRSFVDQWNSGSSDFRTDGKLQKEGEYERFSRSRSIQEASTPNHFNKDSAWKLDHIAEAFKRPNNSSTVSLPNYNEFEIARCGGAHSENEELEAFPARPARKSITGSLPRGTIFPHPKDLNEIQSQDTVDFDDAKDQEEPTVDEKSISKVNTFPDSGGSDSLETMRECLITGDVMKTSTPIKKLVDEVSKLSRKLEESSSADYKPALDLSVSGHEERNRHMGDDSRNGLFSEASHLRNEVFYEAEEDFSLPEGIETRSAARNSDSEARDPGKILKRSLSNESEPFDSFEEKELALDLQQSQIHRTISEESLPREMLEAVDSDLDRADDDREDDFFEEKIVKNVLNNITKDSSDTSGIKEFLKTPPQSPEPKIMAEILGNDHSTLLKVLQEEAATAAESNLSSMTPSLTELEVALSDMLEKRDEQEDLEDPFNGEDSLSREDSLEKTEEDLRSKSTEPRSPEKLIEPCIVPFEKGRKFQEKKDDFNSCKDSKLEVSKDSGFNGNDPDVSKASQEKVKIVAVELKDGSIINNTENNKSPFVLDKEILNDSSKGNLKSYKILGFSFDSKDSKDENHLGDETPEKPSRMHRINLTDSIENDEDAPTPPRRRHRSGSSILKENVFRGTKNGSREDDDPYANDRLI
ncbi:uncharacterized protein LOC117177290 isoform X2 [Belonocnema kinseyi]|uniref:uncharacterized protein LOC117177290 isoform X2 n=1 Tax=Belonocnema kinseyi TaxID=2817044 RepID=UPI00143CE5AC|nr:uncharacterized protein LOC117177290 isoform X2 [Belonocnema kinseyi]